MAIPGNYPLQLYRGDTNKWDFQLWQDSNKLTPTDLTGADTKAEIRDKPGGKTIIELVTAVELPNIIHMSLAPILTQQIPVPAMWDLQITFATGDILTILRGDVSLMLDITDSIELPDTAPAVAGQPVRVVKNVVR